MLILAVATAGLLAYTQVDPNASVPRISQGDFIKLMKAGKIIVVDVRTLDGYKAGHIPSAISIPLPEIAQRWKELPRTKPIVTYCS